MVRAVIERRRAVRAIPASLPMAIAGRLRPGHPMRIVDLSVEGLLIECDRRLLPGSVVEIQIEYDNGRLITRARVVHSRVSTITSDHVTFCGGLELDRPLALPLDSSEPVGVREREAPGARRADVTRACR
jgi:hypothetical protein